MVIVEDLDRFTHGIEVGTRAYLKLEIERACFS